MPYLARTLPGYLGGGLRGANQRPRSTHPVNRRNQPPFRPQVFRRLPGISLKPGLLIARMRFKKSRLILTAACALWLLMIGAGVVALRNYESTPSVAAAAPDRRPAASRIKPIAGRTSAKGYLLNQRLKKARSPSRGFRVRSISYPDAFSTSSRSDACLSRSAGAPSYSRNLNSVA